MPGCPFIQRFAKISPLEDEIIDLQDEPDHNELCKREQLYLLKCIREDLDLKNHWNDAINSMRIVLAADESIKTGNTVSLEPTDSVV